MDSPAPAADVPDPVDPPAAPADGTYLFGPFRMDVPTMQLRNGDHLVALTPKAFDTLLVLIRQRNRLVRKDELLAAIWPNSFVSEDSLAQNIAALRRSLGDDHTHPQYIATIPRRGYRFIAPVTERIGTDEPGSLAQPPPSRPMRPPSFSLRTHRRRPRRAPSGTRAGCAWLEPSGRSACSSPHSSSGAAPPRAVPTVCRRSG